MSKDQQELLLSEMLELFNQVWEEPKIIHLHPFHDLEQLKNILDTAGEFTDGKNAYSDHRMPDQRRS